MPTSSGFAALGVSAAAQPTNRKRTENAVDFVKRMVLSPGLAWTIAPFRDVGNQLADYRLNENLLQTAAITALALLAVCTCSRACKSSTRAEANASIWSSTSCG